MKALLKLSKMADFEEDVMYPEDFNHTGGQDTRLWRNDDGEVVNLTDSNIVTHQCFENGSLMVPIYIDSGNQTLTEAGQVGRRISRELVTFIFGRWHGLPLRQKWEAVIQSKCGPEDVNKKR